MRKGNNQSLKVLLDQLLDSYRLKDGISEVDVRNSWSQIMGAPIAKHTSEIYIKNKVLYVQLDSSVLREELHYAREKIISNINAHVGRELITRVILK